MPPALLLDADVPPALADALQNLGYDVLAASGDPALESLSDADLLAEATRQDRVVVTFNVVDFVALTRELARADRTHAGVIVIHRRRTSLRAAMGRRAVFLDRDGVLNRAPVHAGRPLSPSRVRDVEVLPGVPEACARLREGGFALIVVTNQPDVARGRLSRDAVEAIHDFLRQQLPVDDIRVCYHDDADGCECRKPKPGMLQAAARDFGIDLARSFMVGDRWRDIEAGRRAGCRTIFIDYGYEEPRPEGFDFATDSLLGAAEWICSVEAPAGA